MIRHRIAVIPGDGIGREVVPEGLRVLEAVGRRFGIDWHFETFDWNHERWARTGRYMPEDGLETLARFDAIFLGAVGWPSVPDHVSLWQLLMPIRRGFDLYVNLRPVRLFAGVPAPLRRPRPGEVDMVIVRENTEGEYSDAGGRLFRGTPREMAVQESVFTRHGVDRILHWAFALAARRRGRLTAATKSNGIVHTMPFWDERLAAVAAAHPDVRWEKRHIDALAAEFVRRPERFDVVVASNLFGDILSDLAPALCGTLGLAPSANLDPERRRPSLFEPVHGSAPDIAGRGIANPVGQIWSGALMLEHLGHAEAARAVVAAIERVLAAGRVRTPDLGGRATTEELGRAIAAEI